MNNFAELCSLLGQTANTEYKELLLFEYLKKSEEEDILWALFLLSGHKLQKLVSLGDIWNILSEHSGIPQWLIDESFMISGDKAETISLIMQQQSSEKRYSLSEIMLYIEELKQFEPSVIFEKIIVILSKLNTDEKYYFIKLVTGSFNPEIEISSIVNILIEMYKTDEVSAYHLLKNIDPFQKKIKPILSHYKKYKDTLKIYPFCTTGELNNSEVITTAFKDWQIEWKWDGHRVQFVYRNNELLVWSRHNGLITEKFPEFYQITRDLPNGIVIEGEVVAFSSGKPLPYNILFNRLKSKTISKAVTSEAPIALIAYDLLEYNGIDLREKPLAERRKQLEQLLLILGSQNVIYPSPVLEVRSWKSFNEIKTSLPQYCKGIILKRLDSGYLSEGNRFSLNKEPFSVNGVLLYAQRGSGIGNYYDFTFGVWDEGKLITFTKARNNLTADDLIEVENFIKENTLEKFGPVRIIKPELVFELHFQGIAASKRHKSGITLRNPEINRWLKDKKPHDAGHLNDLKEILNAGK